MQKPKIKEGKKREAIVERFQLLTAEKKTEEIFRGIYRKTLKDTRPQNGKKKKPRFMGLHGFIVGLINNSSRRVYLFNSQLINDTF